MTFTTMKNLDELFGPVACFFFYWYNRVKSIFVHPPRNIDPALVHNILVIKFFGMGSIIQAGPMLRALKKTFPHARIAILTFASNAELCKRIDLIDEVITVSPASLASFMGQMMAALRSIRRRRFDISIDLEFFAKSSTLIQYLCRTPVRVGFFIIHYGIILKMMWRGELLTHNVYYNPHRHVSEAFLALARAIGADTADMSPAALTVYDRDRERLDAALTGAGIGPADTFITLNINASPMCLERRWEAEKYAELCRRIQSAHAGKIVLIGNEQDAPYVRRFAALQDGTGGCIDLSGKLDIGMLARLLERSKLFITNDSGPLHIAAALGRPTVSLFGPEIPERYAPVGPQHATVYAGVYCSPCLNVYNQKMAPCNGDNVCMKKITVDDVYNVVMRFL